MENKNTIDYEKIIVSKKIGIIGLGGAGGNILALFAGEYGCTNCVVMNTDKEELDAAQNVKTKIYLGTSNQPLHYHGDVQALAMKKEAILSSEAVAKEAFKNFKHIIIVFGLGGNCGGNAHEILRMAKEVGVNTTTIVEHVLYFEGAAREKKSFEALELIRPLTDKLVEIDCKFDALATVDECFESMDKIACDKILEELNKYKS